VSDEAAVIDLLGKAWDETDIPQSKFAEILRREADLYEEAPEVARNPARHGLQ
jgi:hypothetical protein